MHTWTAKNWMQYSASHVATTALVLSQMASEAISEHLISKIYLAEARFEIISFPTVLLK